MPPDPTTIRVYENTRERLRHLKRGGQSYDELLHAMADQYDPGAETEVDDGPT